MYIKTMINQNRRDFNAVYKCEDCGHEETKSGYDDANFHDNVIPKMKCKNCKKSRSNLGLVQPKTQTKYSADFVI